MGLFGKLLGTAIDIATSPIAIAKDILPGCNGYIDGNRSKIHEKISQVSNDLEDITKDIKDL